MANVDTIHVPKETKLTISTDENASGHYVRTYSGSQPTNFTALSASQTVVLGPFNDERDYRVTLVGGSFSYTLDFDGTDDAEITDALADYVRNDEPELMDKF